MNLAVFLASPNNPTGGVVTHQQVDQLCQLQCVVVVDEAYAEFAAEGTSAASLLPKYPNLVVRVCIICTTTPAR